ncbi:hypothetical protein WG901_19365 [Novosphingobium sp. PS1R-30]|uniref:Secreted protein n=1 Tax=Novosphingobium anseongense TaxID=3133436 RepID=A0ABU8S0G2_9SPHN
MIAGKVQRCGILARTSLALSISLLLAGASQLPAAASPADPAKTNSTRGITNEVFRNGEAGFVVTQFAYALGPDGKDGACPTGMSAGVRGLIETYSKTAAGQRKADEDKESYERRLSLAVQTAPDGTNICLNPASAPVDPGWRMVTGRVKVDGFDLDAREPGASRTRSVDTCSHEEFQGTNGERGIDNQWYRVVGCSPSFQSSGSSNGFQTEMYTGSWGILMTLKNVDDLDNDPEVEVGFYANADPIELSSTRSALPYATYAATPDARYRATTRGRIVDGVLMIDPVDVRFHNIVNSMTDDRVLRSARVRFKFAPDGGLEGLLAGYTPIDDMYDLQYGARHSRTAKGELAPLGLRLGTSVGRAAVLGHTCNGAYQALERAADGHRNPATGRCTSISTQYKVHLVPAFVVEAKTQSANAPLALR